MVYSSITSLKGGKSIFKLTFFLHVAEALSFMEKNFYEAHAKRLKTTEHVRV
jgi:hypothetical protein